MKKVIFLNNFGESNRDLLKRYLKQTPDDSGAWGDIEGTDNLDEADYYVIMDGTNIPSEKLDWSRVIYFQREPASVYPHWRGHDFPDNILFKGTYEHFYNVPTWWVNLPFNELVNLSYPMKTKKISTVTSGKRMIKEHVDRLVFLNRFVSKYPNIDIFGRGTSNALHDQSSYKGSLNYDGNCKFRGLVDYEYSLVLENILTPNTWSEKPCDAFLSWAFPIYSGASNFDEYFPKESFYQIDANTTDVEEIVDFISRSPSESQIEAMREARNLILFRLNIWATVDRILKERT
jgi:hypothetical protein